MAYAVPTGQHAGPCSCIRGKNAYCCAVCWYVYVLCAVVYVYVCVLYLCVYVALCSISVVCLAFFGNLFGISTNEAQFYWLF